MGTLQYLKNLIRDKNIGSITPSSSFAVKRVCRAIDFSRAKVVVEYGPGGGVFTRYLLKHMAPDATLMLFETNEEFVKVLRQDFNDRRLVLLHESCEFICDRLKDRGLEKADYVISGIPFSFIPPDIKNRIIQNTASALRADGRFLTYQFVPPTASMDPFLRKPLEPHFDLLKVQYEWRNIPPLRIYESRPKRK